MQRCFNFHFAFLSRFIILVRCENKMFCASSTLNFVKTLEKKNCFASFLNAYLSICVPTMSMTLRTYCIIIFQLLIIYSFNPHHSRSVCKRQYVHSDNDLVRFSSFLCYNLIIIICVVYKLLFLQPSYCREHL